MAVKYLFSSRFNTWIDEEKTIQYDMGRDGIIITAGTLLGSGFEPYHLSGLTLPEEINGIQVVALKGSFFQDEVGYIEATNIKRIDLVVFVDRPLYGDARYRFPVLCGGLQKTLQSVRIRFMAEEAHVQGIEDPAIRGTVEYIDFSGKVIDDDDWDYSSFPSRLFSSCGRLKAVRGTFEGYQLSGSTFKDCTSLMYPPDLRVKHMAEREFMNCTALSEIHLHNGLRSIGSECFKHCTALTDLYIPDTVDRIGSAAFDGCSRLETIHFPKTVTSISDRLFAGCESLQKVFLPDGIQSIGREAFLGCRSLKRPWFPEGLTHIGERAFCGCRSMQEVYLPDSLADIGPGAFSDCDHLVIHGKAGTPAEQYAKENGMAFVNG